MKEYQSLSHTRWDCKYHVVFIPKRRKKPMCPPDSNTKSDDAQLGPQSAGSSGR